MTGAAAAKITIEDDYSNDKFENITKDKLKDKSGSIHSQLKRPSNESPINDPRRAGGDQGRSPSVQAKPIANLINQKAIDYEDDDYEDDFNETGRFKNSTNKA